MLGNCTVQPLSTSTGPEQLHWDRPGLSSLLKGFSVLVTDRGKSTSHSIPCSANISGDVGMQWMHKGISLKPFITSSGFQPCYLLAQNSKRHRILWLAALHSLHDFLFVIQILEHLWLSRWSRSSIDWKVCSILSSSCLHVKVGRSCPWCFHWSVSALKHDIKEIRDRKKRGRNSSGWLELLLYSMKVLGLNPLTGWGSSVWSLNVLTVIVWVLSQPVWWFFQVIKTCMLD